LLAQAAEAEMSVVEQEQVVIVHQLLVKVLVEEPQLNKG
jgi:hypothetical protein